MPRGHASADLPSRAHGPPQLVSEYQYMHTGMSTAERRPRPVEWVGSSRRDLKAFPREVQRDVGQALFAAQCGDEYPAVKPLKGFGGRSVLEIVVSFRSDAFRAVYAVRFAEVLYVLHAFLKKSTRGVKTPKRELDVIRRRLAAAEQHYEERRRQHGEEASHHQG